MTLILISAAYAAPLNAHMTKQIINIPTMCPTAREKN